MPGTLCLTFDNMGRAREIGEGLAASPDAASPDLVVGYPRLLALLAELDLRGTFFIEGWNALHHPDRVEDLAARGHEVGLHGWVHERFASLPALRAEQLLYDGTAALERIGLRPAGFRAPGALRGAHTIPDPAAPALSLRQQCAASDRIRTHSRRCWRRVSRTFRGARKWSTRSSTSGIANGRARPPSWKRCGAQHIDRAASTGATLTIVIHAFVSGVDDERFAVVRRVLTHARARTDLEFTTAGMLAERVLSANHPREALCSD